jgi:hypothetical protein
LPGWIWQRDRRRYDAIARAAAHLGLGAFVNAAPGVLAAEVALDIVVVMMAPHLLPDPLQPVRHFGIWRWEIERSRDKIHDHLGLACLVFLGKRIDAVLQLGWDAQIEADQVG